MYNENMCILCAYFVGVCIYVRHVFLAEIHKVLKRNKCADKKNYGYMCSSFITALQHGKMYSPSCCLTPVVLESIDTHT